MLTVSLFSIFTEGLRQHLNFHTMNGHTVHQQGIEINIQMNIVFQTPLTLTSKEICNVNESVKPSRVLEHLNKLW